MARRKLNATPLESADPEAVEDGPMAKGMGGMWNGTAMNLLRQRLEETRASLAEGVMAGTVVLELDPDQIEDAAGSDRTAGWDQAEDFGALVANIQRRGQTQPIRVRPADPAWRPDAENPRHPAGRFVIQSGRRRLAACRRLGLPVRAVLSTEAGDAALADLEERFHENTMRRNLSGFEELLSVGLIAETLSDLSQEEIAERLSVSQNDVSLGLSCVELHDRILAEVDVANTPKRAFRSLIPKLRRGETPPAPAAPKPASARYKGVSVEVRRKGARGATISVEADGAMDIDWIAKNLARMIAEPHKR